jgi:hypothetical protein
LNHFTFPFIRDTFLTPGGHFGSNRQLAPQTGFPSLGFATAFGRNDGASEIYRHPMSHPYTRYFGFVFYFALCQRRMSTYLSTRNPTDYGKKSAPGAPISACSTYLIG